jgi:hypothetical protein
VDGVSSILGNVPLSTINGLPHAFTDIHEDSGSKLKTDTTTLLAIDSSLVDGLRGDGAERRRR